MQLTEEQLNEYDAMIDEMFEDSKTEAKKNLRIALNSGALSEDSYAFSGKYILPKIIISAMFDQGRYEPPYQPDIRKFRKEVKNLRYFI